MNRSSKLFIAAVVLAAGYGVASLLGSPNAPYLIRPQQGGESVTHDGSRPADLPRDNAIANRVGGVRLLPDLSTGAPATASEAPIAHAASDAFSERLNPTTMVPLPLLSEAPVPSPAHPAAAMAIAPPPLNPVEPAAPLNEPPAGVRAKLSDTNPRPLWTPEPAQPLTTLPTANIARPVSESNGRQELPPTAQRSGPAIRERPAEISRSGSAQSVAAEFLKPKLPATPSLPVETAPPRTHRIVDGDSLPKLAKRYLNDRERSGEIFAANRGLLTNPDLLPIGAELTIPANR